MNAGKTSLQQEFNRLAACDLHQDNIHLGSKTTAALIKAYKLLNYMMPFLEIKIDNDNKTTYHVNNNGTPIIVNDKMYSICTKYKRQLGNVAGWYDVITVSVLSSDWKNKPEKPFDEFVTDLYYLSALYILVQNRTISFKTPANWRFFVHNKYYLNVILDIPESFFIDVDHLLDLPTSNNDVAQKYFKMQTYLQRKYVINNSQYSPPLLIANSQTFAFNIPEYKFTQVKYEMDRQVIKTEAMGNNYVRPLFTFHYTVDNVSKETFYHMSNLYWNVCMYKEMYNKLPVSTLVYDTQYLMNKLTLSKPVQTKVPDYSKNVVQWLDANDEKMFSVGVLYTLDDFNGDTEEEKQEALIKKFQDILARFKTQFKQFPDMKTKQYLWIDRIKKQIVMRLGSSDL